ncbi:MAG TPA: hypothetical protein PK014_13390 [Thermoanaerobaculia bacterium]|nr:hypothetical protein [Thermoanaerobaculia bacterium]HUM30967.1 hypothetical protein [Thermoanaerobaculia bacterium]HXK69373.1 hypothetical protein [Thermoanaerobaculia bacterium]
MGTRYLLSIGIAVLGIFILTGCQNRAGQAGDALPAESLLELAGQLKQEGLLPQAARLYEQTLFAPGLSSDQRGKTAFMLAELEFNDLDDPESAYTHYLMADRWVQDESLRSQIQKQKVAALERSGRSMAASRVLKESTDLKAEDRPSPGDGERIVATIGKREVGESEVRAALDRLPPERKSAFSGKDGFARFVDNYVASLVLVDAAKRAGLDSDPSVQERFSRLKDEVLTNAYLERELKGKISVDEVEVRRYYEEHKKQFTDSESGAVAPFEEVREACANAVRFTKQSQAVNALLGRLYKASSVEIHAAE